MSRAFAFAILAAVGGGVLVPLVPLPAQEAVGKKYALLVGVNKYQHAKLPALKWAENDASELAALLKNSGYQTVLLSDAAAEAKLRPTKANVEAQLREILRAAKSDDTVLIALAGHGLQFEGQKDAFFCPADARPFKDEVETLVSLGKVYDELDKSFAGVKVLLVDACRDDPNAGRGSRGVDADAAPPPPKGVAALFSCSAGQRAFEHDDLKHGVFFHHVLEGLKGSAKNSRGHVTFNGLSDYVATMVKEDVPKLIGGGAKQLPNQKGEFTGGSPVLLAKAVERMGGDVVKFEIADGVFMEFCWIPGGKAQLGSSKAERNEVLKALGDSEEPAWLSREPEGKQPNFETKGFWLGKYEVTQEEWEKVMGKNPSYFNGMTNVRAKGKHTPRFPVENVSWNDCQDFLKEINKRPGFDRVFGKGGRFVLPHQDEWEYACRGGKGNGQPYYFGHELNGTQANCSGDSPFGTATKGANLKRTCEVGSYAKDYPHPWGLSDMHGNVSEWCGNTHEGSVELRGLSGGSWESSALFCRAASRDRGGAIIRLDNIGLRVCVRLD